MSRFHLIHLPLWAGVAIFTSASTLVGHGQPPDARSQALQKVREFEARISQQMFGKNEFHGKLRDLEEFRNEIRALFAGLETREMKLEAIGMLDSRYVYIVSPPFATELLGPLIRDADPAVRAQAAHAIGRNGGGARYATELTAMLDGEPPKETLVNVAFAMSRSAHQPFVPHLEKLLGHASEEVRYKALIALTELAPATAFNHNLRLLDDNSPAVRTMAIRNITRPPGNVVVTSLTRMLNDKDSTVRENAVQALGQLTAPNSADAIKERLADENHLVRYQAALTLGQMR